MVLQKEISKEDLDYLLETGNYYADRFKGWTVFPNDGNRPPCAVCKKSTSEYVRDYFSHACYHSRSDPDALTSLREHYKYTKHLPREERMKIVLARLQSLRSKIEAFRIVS